MKDRVSGMLFLLVGILSSIFVLTGVVYLANIAKRMDTELNTRRELQEELNDVVADNRYLDPSRFLTTDEVIEFIRDHGMKYNYFIVVETETVKAVNDITTDDYADKSGNKILSIAHNSTDALIADITPSSELFKNAYEEAVRNSGVVSGDLADKETYLQKNFYTSNYLRGELLKDYIGLNFRPYIYVSHTNVEADDFKKSIGLSQSEINTQSSEQANFVLSNAFHGWTSLKAPATAGRPAEYYDLLSATVEGSPYVIVFKQWTRDKYLITWYDVANPNFDYTGGIDTLPDSYKSTNPTYYPPNASTVSRLGYVFNGWSPSSIPHGSSGDVEFRGNWTANKYNLHFNTNGGDCSRSADVVVDYSDGYGDPGYALPGDEEMSRNGYIFAGWYLDPGLTMPAENPLVGGYFDDGGNWHGGSVIPNPDGSIDPMTLYAKWVAAPSHYQVNYISSTGKVIGNGGTQSADYGATKTLTYPSGGIPNINGYTPNVTTTTVTVTATGDDVQQVNITYTPITYTITYDMGIPGGTAVGGPTTYTIEDVINFTNTNPTPTGYDSTGYRFLGWEPESLTNTTGNQVIKAKWEAITKPFTVHCLTTSTGNAPIAQFTYNKNLATLSGASSFVIPAPVSNDDSNYQFSGVSNPVSGSLLGYQVHTPNSKTVNTTDASVTFMYDPIVYNIVYRAQDDPTVTFYAGDSSVKQTYTVEDPKDKITLTPERNGYKFVAWSPDSYLPSLAENADADNNVYVEAIWEPIKYPLDYIGTGGEEPTVNGGAKWDYYTVVPSDNYYDTFKLDPMKNGFNADGYYYYFDRWDVKYQKEGEGSIINLPGKTTVATIPVDKTGDTAALNTLLRSGVDIANMKYYPDPSNTATFKSLTITQRTGMYYFRRQVGADVFYSPAKAGETTGNPSVAAIGPVTLNYYAYESDYPIGAIETTRGQDIIKYEDIGRGLGTSDPKTLTFSAVFRKTYWSADFDYTGNVQTFNVPETGYYMLECWGANGGGDWENLGINSAGGIGGYARGLKQLTKGTTLYIFVGGKGTVASSATFAGGGYNGGGHGANTGYGGGGMTHISTTNNPAKSTIQGTAGEASFGYTGRVQSYTAPETATYKVDAYGAAGGNDAHTGGKGGRIYGSFNLSKGETIYIYVGGAGGVGATNSGGGWPGGGNAGPSGTSGGGGGATIVAKNVKFTDSPSGSDNQTWGVCLPGVKDHYYMVDYWGNDIVGDNRKTSYYDIPYDSSTFHEGSACLGARKLREVIYDSNHVAVLYQATMNSGLLEFKTFGKSCTEYTGSAALDVTDIILIAGGGGGGGNLSVGGAGGTGGTISHILAQSHSADGAGGGGGYLAGATQSGDNGGVGGTNYSSGATVIANQQGVRDGNGMVKVTYSTISLNEAWNETGTIILAGGGGGADNASGHVQISTNSADDGSGGCGGGNNGGNARIDGADSVAAGSSYGTGAGGTQSAGYAKGLGESASRMTDTGGGGGGYYGGRATNHNNGGAGGGSAHNYSTSDYETFSGAEAYAQQNTNSYKNYLYQGTSMSGVYGDNKNNGNGRVRITWKGDAGAKATSNTGAWREGKMLTYEELRYHELVVENPAHGFYWSNNRKETITYYASATAMTPSTYTNTDGHRICWYEGKLSGVGEYKAELITNFNTN